jgi:hypothetical protein
MRKEGQEVEGGGARREGGMGRDGEGGRWAVKEMGK